ncbi:unnamed protein product [Ilex paraguariensis]|uniref:Cation/H+ exchanger domain-containing protein n=1 Tax=Ilex paraguariensis TaxID=185542 RepID=A0ABC8U9E1_9AQUA
MGRINVFSKTIFPNYYFAVLEPMAHLALVFYAFLMGLEMDIRSISRTGTKAWSIAAAGAVIPFVFGAGLFFMFQTPDKMGSFFWGIALTVTGFTVLARILEKQKILHTEIGKTALSVALVNDFGSWIFLALALALSSGASTFHWALVCTIAFVMFCVYYVRAGLKWVIRHTPEGQGYSEFYICFILSGVMLCGALTDACGTHPMIGAFVFGLSIPNEMLQATLVDKLEDFVLGFFMPIFFAVCGVRTNLDHISDNTSWALVMVVVVLACSAKVLGTLFASFFYNIPPREAVAVGVLSNTKSVMVMVILEVGQQQGALTTQTYTIMVVAVLVMTMIVTPLTMIQQPSQSFIPYRRKTIQNSRSEDELRILACIHGTRNIPAIINLLEASNATQRSPISVFALQLVELVGRASAMLVVHNSRKAGPRNPSHVEAQTEQLISAFDNFELRCEGITTQALTAKSSYSSMDEDICNIAKDKRAAFIILPFHKQHTLNGDMEDINPAIKSVNENVLANAPCSVGILIDRGLAETDNFARRVTMLYFGGPDDREALSYAWRMAEHQDISLTVVRFLPGKDVVEHMDYLGQGHGTVALNIDTDREKMLDNEFLNKFKISTVNDKAISYTELELNDEEETIKAIKSMDNANYDLYIVGKGRGVLSPLTAGLADWCDCPELGPIGDLLVTSEFLSAFSVLVVQQYIRTTESRDGSVSSGSVNQMDNFGRPSVSENDGFGSFTSHRGRDHDH